MLPDSSGCHIIRKEMPILQVLSEFIKYFWKIYAGHSHKTAGSGFLSAAIYSEINDFCSPGLPPPS